MQNLVSVTVNLSNNDPPIYFLTRLLSKKKNLTRTKIGTVQEAFNEANCKFITLCNAYFRLSKSVLVPTDHPVPILGSFKCKLKFHLLGVEALKLADNIKPMQIDKLRPSKFRML
jgi:hypothetical protein